MAKLSDVAAINPTRKVKRGEFVPFIQMAALPLSGRDISAADVEIRVAKAAGAHFQNGDTLLARITPCLENGKTAQVSVLAEGAVGEGSTEFIVLCGHDSEDDDFVYYLCREPEFRKFAISRMEGTSGRQRVSWQSIAGYPIELPPPEVRRDAAGFLAILDDRIANLRQTNITLEAIAAALFKSRFVDFDNVPLEDMQEAEMGAIPQGWRMGTFAEAVEILGGGTPKTSIADYWNGDIPWFSVVDAPASGQVFVLDTEKKITSLGLDNCSAKLLPEMTTIISARGTVGKVAMTGVPMAMNQSCYALRPKQQCGEAFVYFSTLRFVEHLQRVAHGAVFDTITRDSFKQITTCLPPGEAIAEFAVIANPLLERIRANGQQAATLAALRDTLLPSLISGRLRVNQ